MDIVDFNKKVSKKELIERLKYYKDKADEGLSLIDNNLLKAQEICRSLKESLKNEYKEYEKVKINNMIQNNPVYVSYVSAITDAYIHINRGSKKNVIYGNLYDIMDYVSYGLYNIN